MKTKSLMVHRYTFFQATTRPDFESSSQFNKLSLRNSLNPYLRYSHTQDLLTRFQNAQGMLVLEKLGMFLLSNILGAAIIMNTGVSETARRTFIALNLMVNLILLKYFSVETSYQKEHDTLLIELYNRYRQLTISGPSATHNQEATDILAAIHAELSVHQMEPWRNSTERTDYTQVSDMFRQIRAIHLHLSTDTFKVGFWDSAYMNVVFQTSVMRESALKDHQLNFSAQPR